jgi:hypothetical protein
MIILMYLYGVLPQSDKHIFENIGLVNIYYSFIQVSLQLI